MFNLDGTTASYAFIALQIAGLTASLLARLMEGSPLQTACQRAFLAAMAAVGVAAAVSLLAGREHCLLCGFTLALMSLIATTDFSTSRTRRIEAF